MGVIRRACQTALRTAFTAPAQQPGSAARFASVTQSVQSGLDLGHHQSLRPVFGASHLQDVQPSAGLHMAPWSVLRPVDIALSQYQGLRTMGGSQRHSSSHAEALPALLEQEGGSFDATEFLQGCRHAIQTILELHGAQDFYSLRGLVSSSLLSTLREEHRKLRSEQGLQVSLLSVSLGDVRLSGLQRYSSDDVRAFDKHKVARNAKDSTWLVATVEVCATVHVSLMDALGEPVAHHDLGRNGRWLFARGPLPSPGMPDAQCPWFVLGWS